MIAFVESAAFTSVWSAYADPDELHALMKASMPGPSAPGAETT